LVITHKQPIQDIWGDDAANNVRYLRTLVRKPWQKLEADPSEQKLLILESGVGYRLERNAAPSQSRANERRLDGHVRKRH
jgi:two-component system KDP operon response regulator KdpE